MITERVRLHSVLLPLLITFFAKQYSIFLKINFLRLAKLRQEIENAPDIWEHSRNVENTNLRLMFSTFPSCSQICRVLSQCNTRLRLLYLRDTLTSLSGEGRGYIVTSCPSSPSVKRCLSIFAESRRREKNIGNGFQWTLFRWDYNDRRQHNGRGNVKRNLIWRNWLLLQLKLFWAQPNTLLYLVTANYNEVCSTGEKAGPASYLGRDCCWLSTVLRVVFLRDSGFQFLSPQKQHFQIPIRS